MADYNINAVTRRVVFSGSAGVGPYAFTFEILAQTDIAVYKNSTKLTLTTDYTVTINANGTGSVTLVVAATGSDTITIIGSRAIERTTDFVTAGDLLASSLNEQLDSQIVMIQQLAEENKRTIKAPAYDPADVADGGTANLTLPAAADRANHVLAFDASGNPIATEEIGEWKGNWAASTTYAKRDIVKDSSNSNVYRANTAHTSSGSTPISGNADAAKWDLVVDAAAAGASAAAAAVSASNAATSESNASSSASSASSSASSAVSSATAASSAQSAAESARDATLAAYDNFDDRYLGAKSSDPTLDNDGNALIAGALYFDTVSEAMKIYTGSAWVAAYVSGSGFLASSNNLSDVANVSSARTNLGLGSLATLSTVTNAELSAGAAVANIGYTPVDVAGDTMTGTLNLPSDGLTVGTDQLVASGGNVGIGTSTPAQKLSVAGTVESTTGGFKFPDGTTQTSAASGGIEPGDTLVTARTLSSPEFITESGRYLKTDYPLIGSMSAFNESGTNWSDTSATVSSAYGLGYGNGTWLACSGSSSVTRSTDGGNTWSTVLTPNIFGDVAYGNGVWIARYYSGPSGENYSLYRSTNDGLTWSAVGSSIDYYTSMHYANGVWIATANFGRIYRSTNDGATWSSVTSGTTNTLYSVQYGNGVWIIVGSSVILRSTDNGVSWTTVSYSGSTLYQVNYGNGVWIATSNDDNFWRSTDDGLTWETQPLFINVRNAAYGNGTWLLVGTSSLFKSNDNGKSFGTTANAASWFSYRTIAYGGGVWMSRGYNGTTNKVIRSVDDATKFWVPSSRINLYTGE